ncbi:gp251 [Sphingomonas phage PAU]|uniref:gp251 n=1 Tax=Sphingomonas phage PAU TaxID=1150991 RepID=UPI0002573401|nr:gp251 [Sphingomonas phage PAU]AFF28249.1 gp251 [Sphingomonas phage PAU]
MNTIYFRGKDILTGSWVYGYYYKHNEVHGIFTPGRGSERVTLETVGQLVYELDDTMVFVGDIMTNPRGQKFEVVIYDNLPSLKPIDRQQYNAMSNGYMQNKTLIGNKFDNPELLK